MKAVDSGSDSDRKRSRSRSRSPAKFREGDKVEARLSGQSKWSKAKVRRVRDDTYDLEFDDGEREKRVKPKYIRKRGGSRSRSRSRSRSPRGRKLREGDKCEARFRGKSSAKYLRGVLRPSTSHRWRRGVTRRSPTPSPRHAHNAQVLQPERRQRTLPHASGSSMFTKDAASLPPMRS